VDLEKYPFYSMRYFDLIFIIGGLRDLSYMDATSFSVKESHGFCEDESGGSVTS
jgi:hypothetical protein